MPHNEKCMTTFCLRALYFLNWEMLVRLCDDDLSEIKVMRYSKGGGDLCRWHQCNFSFLPYHWYHSATVRSSLCVSCMLIRAF